MAAALVVLSGLAVHRLLPDTAASDIAGDALYAALIYALVVIAVPRAPVRIPFAIAVAWCTVIELFQLTGLPQVAASVFPPAVLVLGTVFDVRDLLVYVVTLIGVAAVDAAVLRMRSAR